MRTKFRLNGNEVVIGIGEDIETLKVKTRHEKFDKPVTSESKNEYKPGIRLDRITSRTTTIIV